MVAGLVCQYSQGRIEPGPDVVACHLKGYERVSQDILPGFSGSPGDIQEFPVVTDIEKHQASTGHFLEPFPYAQRVCFEAII